MNILYTDFAELARLEHRHSELIRLDAGVENCGCPDCQEFYKTIDMEKYGARVRRFGGIISISPGPAVRKDTSFPAVPDGNQQSSQPQGVVSIISNGERRGRGRPRLTGAALMAANRVTLWRRAKDAKKMAEALPI